MSTSVPAVMELHPLPIACSQHTYWRPPRHWVKVKISVTRSSHSGLIPFNSLIKFRIRRWFGGAELDIKLIRSCERTDYIGFTKPITVGITCSYGWNHRECCSKWLWTVPTSTEDVEKCRRSYFAWWLWHRIFFTFDVKTAAIGRSKDRS